MGILVVGVLLSSAGPAWCRKLLKSQVSMWTPVSLSEDHLYGLEDIAQVLTANSRCICSCC
jgi:hypothetical protein